MNEPRVRLTGIEKAFGANRVLKGVDFEVLAGEVHTVARVGVSAFLTPAPADDSAGRPRSQTPPGTLPSTSLGRYRLPET